MRYACLVLLLAVLGQGCGYKGPLYLPKNPAQPQQEGK